MDKVELINYLFRSFNKDPYQHKDQVKHFLIECQEYEAGVVDRAVREAIVLCNGMGLIFSPFHLSDDGIQVEIVSKEHKPRLEGRYNTKIVGACRCLNGEIYAATKKRVEPWAYIVDGAMDNNWDCVFQADYVAKGYNRIIKGKDNFKKNPHIEKLVNNIVGRYGKE